MSKTTLAGVAKGLFTLGTGLAAVAGLPRWAVVAGVVALSVSHVLGGIVTADAPESTDKA